MRQRETHKRKLCPWALLHCVEHIIDCSNEMNNILINYWCIIKKKSIRFAKENGMRLQKTCQTT